MTILVVAAGTRSRARPSSWTPRHRNTEEFLGGTNLGETVPSRARCSPLKGLLGVSVSRCPARRPFDVSDGLRGRTNIGLKNPNNSHKTLKPGPYGARKPFMRLP